MAWPGTLLTKITGDLVDADDWNDVINGINFLGNTHDHTGDAGDGGTVPAGLTKIAENEVTGSSVASVTLGSIPATFRALLVVYQHVAATDATNMEFEINGDTGGNYDWQTLGTANNSSAAGDNQIVVNLDVGSIRMGNAANEQGGGSLLFVNYAETNQRKVVITDMGYASQASGSFLMVTGSGLWKDTSAISSILFRQSSGNLAINTFHTLYGLSG